MATAAERAEEFSQTDFEHHVLPFIDPDFLHIYHMPHAWEEIQGRVVSKLHELQEQLVQKEEEEEA